MEEIEWAVKEALETGKPVVASMCIGPYHDLNGVPTGECAVRMAKAGRCCTGTRTLFSSYSSNSQTLTYE